MIPVLIAVAMSLVGWGVALLPQYTLSTEVEARSIHPDCRVDSAHLECSGDYEPLGHSDLAAGWVESPIDYFYREAARETSKLPNWSPDIGSGYPIVFDGHNGHYSPTRWFLRHFPGDGGRDTLIFVRAFVWVLGVSLLTHLCGATPLLVWVAALGAAFATSFVGMVDHVFLDVHALAPWFGVLVAASIHGRLNFRVAMLLSVLLGVLVGALGFLQAQFVALLATGIVACSALSRSRLRLFGLALGVASGFLLAWPAWVPLVRHLNDFVSSRDVLACIARDNKTGIVAFIAGMTGVTQANYLVGTLAGFALILIRIRRLGLAFPVLSLGVFTSVVVFGMPLACGTYGISGIRFAQHIFPYAQCYFLVAVALAMNAFLARWPESGVKRGAGALVLILLVMPPFLFSRPARRGYVGKLLQRKFPHQMPALPRQLPSESPWSNVRELSRNEDRRHFSPLGLLMPNWPAAFGVLDLRLIAALYPKDYFKLNSGLFELWDTHPTNGIRPDRFIMPVAPNLTFHPNFQRVLIVNRVSLLTFSAGASFFSRATESPYSRERCRLVKGSPSVEAYVCPSVGGVGYFPGKVVRVDSSSEALAGILKTPLSSLGDTAFIEAEGEPIAGAGIVREIQRSGDDLAYEVDVSRRGTFVVADTWFPGWEARIDGLPVMIQRANAAFKSVSVPEGRHRLAFHFSPGRW